MANIVFEESADHIDIHFNDKAADYGFYSVDMPLNSTPIMVDESNQNIIFKLDGRLLSILYSDVDTPASTSAEDLKHKIESFFFKSPTVLVQRNKWYRNSDWLELPSITTADSAFYGLFLVFEGEYNATTIQANSGSVDIDWGDGTSTTTTGATQLKEYDYASLSGDVYVDEYGKNYKQVIISYTYNSGSWTWLYIDLSSGLAKSNSTNNFVDIVCSLPTITALRLGTDRRLRICERIRVLTHASTSMNNFLRDALELRVLELDFTNFINQSSCLFGVRKLELLNKSEEPTISFTGTSSSTFNNCGIKTWSLVTIYGTGTHSGCFTGNTVERINELNIPSATVLSNMLNGATSLKYLYVVAPSATTLTNFCIYDYALEELIFSDCSAVTVTTNMVLNCYSLKRLVMPGLTVGINLSDCDMNADALDEFFTSLGTASGSQTITVTGNPGAGTCDTSIATGKGFTVAT